MITFKKWVLLSLWPQGEGAIYEPRNESSSDAKSVGALILYFPGSKVLTNRFILLISQPLYDTLWQQSTGLRQWWRPEIQIHCYSNINNEEKLPTIRISPVITELIPLSGAFCLIFILNTCTVKDFVDSVGYRDPSYKCVHKCSLCEQGEGTTQSEWAFA